MGRQIAHTWGGGKYSKSKNTKYITYLDANNLYGWAMSKPLLTQFYMDE